MAFFFRLLFSLIPDLLSSVFSSFLFLYLDICLTPCTCRDLPQNTPIGTPIQAMSRAAPPLAPPVPAPRYPSLVHPLPPLFFSLPFIAFTPAALRAPCPVPSCSVSFRSLLRGLSVSQPSGGSFFACLYLPLPSIGCIIWCSMYGRDRTPVYIVCCVSRRAARLAGFTPLRFSRTAALAASVSRRGGFTQVLHSWQ